MGGTWMQHQLSPATVKLPQPIDCNAFWRLITWRSVTAAALRSAFSRCLLNPTDLFKSTAACQLIDYSYLLQVELYAWFYSLKF